MARGPIAQERLSIDGDGLIVLELKRSFSDGTTHALFEPQDFISRLAALDCMDAGGRATQEPLPRPRAQLQLSRQC